MKRITGLDINKTDKVYKMASGRMLKVRVAKKDVLPQCVSFTVSCSEVDKKGKALVTDEGHVIAPPLVVTIPAGSKEKPLDVIKKEIEGHKFTKNGKETIIKGRLEHDDEFFASMKALNDLDNAWQND